MKEPIPTFADAEDVVGARPRHRERQREQCGSYVISLAILAGLVAAPVLALLGIVGLLASPLIGLHGAAPYLLIAASCSGLTAISCAEVWRPGASPKTREDVDREPMDAHKPRE